MQSTRQFDAEGYFVERNVLSRRECDHLGQHLGNFARGVAGSRRFLEQPWCAKLATVLKCHEALSRVLPSGAVAVQCTLFAKAPGANWSVAPHQDLSIPVASRVDAPQCSGWAEKEGTLFVQPPAEVLASLVAVRVHIDASGPNSGPLRIAPGSHRFGRLPAGRVAQSFAASRSCVAPRGAALAFRPLLVHASSKAVATVPRRVLHFLFGPPSLPLGLRWAHAV